MTSYEETVVAVQEMLSVSFPRPSGTTPGQVTAELRASFEASQLFTVLTRIRMEKGYALDYVYSWRPDFDGYPLQATFPWMLTNDTDDLLFLITEDGFFFALQESNPHPYK